MGFRVKGLGCGVAVATVLIDMINAANEPPDYAT